MKRYIVTYRAGVHYAVYDRQRLTSVRFFWRKRDARRTARYMNKTASRLDGK